MKRGIGMIACLCIAAVTRASEDNPDCSKLINQFMTSLPFKVAYAKCAKPPRAPFTFGTQFVTLRKADFAVDQYHDRYLLLESPLLFDRCVIPYFFPRTDDSSDHLTYVTPLDSIIEFRSTQKPIVPSDSVLKQLERVIQEYSVSVRKYVLARDEYNRNKPAAYATFVLYPIAIAATAILISSDNETNRGIGYGCAGVIGIGLYLDTQTVISWLQLKKEAQAARSILAGWNESTTQRILDNAVSR